MAHSVSWLEVIKGVVSLLARVPFLFLFVFRVHTVFCFLIFGCQYQCNQLPGRLISEMTCYVSSGRVGR